MRNLSVVDGLLVKLVILAIVFIAGGAVGWFWQPVIKLVLVQRVSSVPSGWEISH